MREKIIDYSRENNIKFNLYVALVFTFILCIVAEFITRTNLFDLGIVGVAKPMLFFQDWFVIVILLLVTSALADISYGIVTTSVLTLLISIVSIMKYAHRGVHLIPSDLYLIKEIAALTKYVNIPKMIVLGILLIGSIVASVSFLKKMPLLKFEIRHRVRLLLFSVILVMLMPVLDTFGSDMGVLYSFASQLNIFDSEKIIESSDLKSYKGSEQKIAVDADVEKPDVVIIMSESFWDINLLKNVEYNQEPLRFFNAIKDKATYGYIESPEFGGGTSNVEFEVLTGHSTHLYPPGHIMYTNDMLEKPTLSLASIFKKHGYNTTAIHSFERWYYDRDQVYENIGFDEFIAIDQMEDAPKRGDYIADEYITDSIIETLEKSEEPSFVFSVTMQNHGPYNELRYKEFDIEIKNELEYESNEILQNYAQGLYESDKALERLITYCENREKPTVVLFFGDHLPTLGENFRIYKEFGFRSEKITPEEYLSLYKVPFILWSSEDLESCDLKTINASFMGNYVMNMTNLEKPEYYYFLDEMYNNMAAISRTYFIDKDDILNKEDKETFNKYTDLYKSYQFNVLYSEEPIDKEWIDE